MKRSAFALSLLVLSVCLFTGCRSKQNDNSTPSTTTAPTTMATTEPTRPETTAAAQPTVPSGNGPIDESESTANTEAAPAEAAGKSNSTDPARSGKR